jgi:hypothetical protein
MDMWKLHDYFYDIGMDIIVFVKYNTDNLYEKNHVCLQCRRFVKIWMYLVVI